MLHLLTNKYSLKLQSINFAYNAVQYCPKIQTIKL